MPIFIQLTRATNQQPIYVNLVNVKRIGATDEGATIASIGDEDGVRVVESYDEVVQKVRDALLRAAS